MSIARNQVADLQPGDVVRVTLTISPDVVTEGPVTEDSVGTLRCGPVFLRYSLDRVASELHSLTIVSRAPRPLYVNHSRTEPVAGDVVRDADSDDPAVYMLADGDDKPWIRGNDSAEVCTWSSRSDLPARLRLLVNGETGRTVP